MIVDHDQIHHQSSIIIRKVLTIEEIVIHPSYDHSGYSFDIALLKVFIVFMFILIMILDVILPELFELVLILRCLMLNLFFAEPSQSVGLNICSILSLIIFKLSESVDLDTWSPACLPTSVSPSSSLICLAGNFMSRNGLFVKRSPLAIFSFQGADFTGQNGWVYGAKYICPFGVHCN